MEEDYGAWRTKENYERWIKSKIDKISTDEEQEEMRKNRNEMAKIYSRRLRERDGDALRKYDRERKRRYALLKSLN